MGDIVQVRNIGALGNNRRLADHATTVAGGAGNNVAVLGAAIDRLSFGNGSMPMSADVSVEFETTLAAGATLSISSVLQDSADGVTWADYQVTPVAVASTGAVGGSTNKSTYSVPVNLTGARRYIRFNYTPVHSAATLDTSYSDASAFFGGSDRLPVN